MTNVKKAELGLDDEGNLKYSNSSGDRWRDLSSGFTPVSVSLSHIAENPLEIQADGTHRCKWTKAVDDDWENHVLEELPENLGIYTAIDGTSGKLWVTEPGVWAFTLTASVQDETWAGDLILDYNSQALITIPPLAEGFFSTVSAILKYPAGAQIEPGVRTKIEATTTPCRTYPSLVIVRLG